MTTAPLVGRKHENIRSGFYVALFLVCPLGLSLALLLKKWRYRGWVVVFSFIWLYPLVDWWPVASDINVTIKFIYFWLMGTGLVGILLWMVLIWEAAMQGTIGEFLKQYRKTDSKPLTDQGTTITLGKLVQANSSFEDWIGVQLKAGNVEITNRARNQHTLIVGSSDTGKTNTIYHHINEVARKTNRDIFVVDCKGELKFALDIANIIYKARGTPVPLCLLGHEDAPTSLFDSFKGSPDAIYNRFAALIGIPDMIREDRYYGEMYGEILDLACHAPQGPPRSFDDLKARMDVAHLKVLWKGHPDESSDLLRLGKDADKLRGIISRVNKLKRRFGRYMGPEGFSLETTSAAVFSIKKLSIGVDANKMIDFLMLCLGDYITNRMKAPADFIIDEFGAMGNESVKPFLMQGRVFELAMSLATQTMTSMGDMDERKEYMALCNNLFLMNSALPDEIIELAGTVQQMEMSTQQRDGETTGNTFRTSEQFRLKANDIRSLRPGEGYLMRKNASWKIQVPLMPPIEHVPLAVLVYAKQESVPELEDDDEEAPEIDLRRKS